jgi:hypothetical protein
MKKYPPTTRTGNVVNIIELSCQHLKKARKMDAILVTMVVIKRLIFSPVAV